MKNDKVLMRKDENTKPIVVNCREDLPKNRIKKNANSHKYYVYKRKEYKKQVG